MAKRKLTWHPGDSYDFGTMPADDKGRGAEAQSAPTLAADADGVDSHADTAMVVWVDKTGDDDATFWIIGRRGLSDDALRVVYDALTSAQDAPAGA